ncbi:hypothetical protein Anapl_06798 [Anas platyrhynchos]|uniref:Uncharacterized protein n=1 Tax=Anas platyrhynchos TaxID=8839 RepID=R0LJB9_ANAPL|nr:hypothetical protein Anapl_06798 [Anas platyrhynchos]
MRRSNGDAELAGKLYTAKHHTDSDEYCHHSGISFFKWSLAIAGTSPCKPGLLPTTVSQSVKLPATDQDLFHAVLQVVIDFFQLLKQEKARDYSDNSF